MWMVMENILVHGETVIEIAKVGNTGMSELNVEIMFYRGKTYKMLPQTGSRGRRSRPEILQIY